MAEYNNKASRADLESIAEKLTAHGMTATVVATGTEAKAKVLSMIPVDQEVLTMTSITLETIGLTQALQDAGYTLIRNTFADPEVSPKHKRELGAAPDVSIASAHAVTESGEIVIASGSGSQLAALVYGAGKAILIIGAQKVVADVQEAVKRIYEYVLPLESVRMNKAYNVTTGSSVNKILIINKELQKGRIEVILVEEPLGF